MSFADEQRHIDELVRVNLRTVRNLPGLARRGPHTKHHGCVEARFRVLDDVPKDLRVGLFAEPREFPALIRFSNGFNPDDRRGDVHGMAIKVLDVEGTKLLANRQNERAQDFLLMDSETFPTGNPAVYGLVNRLQKRQGWLVYLASLIRVVVFHWPVLKAVNASRSKTPSSLLETAYFSTTPYALGPERAVKYLAEPLQAGGNDGVDTPDGLGEDLATRLRDNEALFDFSVDVQADAKTHPIEDPRVSWSGAGGRRVKLAKIVIPRQELDRFAPLAENLVFSPWHALTAHKPLGYINRARCPVYGEMAGYRHETNRIVPPGSSEAPPSYRHMPRRLFGSLYWDPPTTKKGFLAKLVRHGEDLAIRAAERWPWILRVVERLPWLRRFVNRKVINRLACKTAQRPLPLTLWTPGDNPVAPPDDSHPLRTHGTYVSWAGLTDRSFTSRHLPPIDEAQADALPEIDDVVALFRRKPTNGGNGAKPSPDSSALLCFFAQWLSDSFLRTHPDDTRRNTSNHELDLCQVYGLGQESTLKLRETRDGRLRSRKTKFGELPPLLVNPDTLEVEKNFAGICFEPVLAASFDPLDPPRNLAGDLHDRLKHAVGDWAVAPDRWLCHYAGGLDRANSTLLYSAFNTLFLREHNRLAHHLRQWYATNDDDWLFETARNINIVKYLKILIEDYLSHIAGEFFKIRVEPGFADRCLWYRTNRISIEFNLLYRWHSLVPDAVWIWDESVGGRKRTLPNEEFRFNNAIIEQRGIESIIDAASCQPAGLVGLHNTPGFLLHAERKSILFARQFRLAPFNAYRKRWQLDPYKDFMEMTGNDKDLADELDRLYPDRDGVRGVDRVEFTVGLFAETRRKKAVLPTLLSLMVASDAFSHALTNPLLAAYVYGENALTEYGLLEIERVNTLSQIMRDNLAPGMPTPLVSFGWPPPK